MDRSCDHPILRAGTIFAFACNTWHRPILFASACCSWALISDGGPVKLIVNFSHRALLDIGTVINELPEFILPKTLDDSPTCAPISTTTSGSIVPEALIIAIRSLRLMGDVRNAPFFSNLEWNHQAQMPPATARQINATIVIRTARLCIASKTCQPTFLRRLGIQHNW